MVLPFTSAEIVEQTGIVHLQPRVHHIGFILLLAVILKHHKRTRQQPAGTEQDQ